MFHPFHQTASLTTLVAERVPIVKAVTVNTENVKTNKIQDLNATKIQCALPAFAQVAANPFVVNVLKPTQFIEEESARRMLNALKELSAHHKTVTVAE